MKSRIALLGALCACLVMVGGSLADLAEASAQGVVISEFRVRGPNGGNDEFIELYNASAGSVSIGGWQIRGSNSAGTTSARSTINAGTTLGAGCHYLVTNSNATAGPYSGAVAGDQLYTVGVADDGGIGLTLADGTTVVDQVGMSAGSAYKEGTTLTNLGTTNLDRGYERKPGGASGSGQDTDNNASDFAVVAPSAPQNSLSTCIGGGNTISINDVSINEGNSGTTSFNFTVSLASPAGADGVTFDIETADGSATTADSDYTAKSLTGQTISEGNSTYTFSVLVTGDTTAEPNETFFVNLDNVTGATVADGQGQGTIVNDDAEAVTLIHEIQGSGAASAMDGSERTIQGIVTGDYQQTGSFAGYYVQEEDADADADAATSEGMFVFNPSTAVSPGDLVRVRGTVDEFFNLTELTSVTSVTVVSTGNPLPAATDVSLPVSALSDFERYEGMLVHFPQTLTANETFTLGRFGEVRLAQGGRLYNPTAVTTPGAAAATQEELNQRRSFILDDGDNQQNIDPTIHPVGGLSASNTLRSGYTTDNLTGVLEERFNVYRVQPVGPIPFTATNPRTPAPDAVGGNLKVASFNVLNFFNGNGTHQEGAAGGFPTDRGAETLFEFNRQLPKEVSALKAIDADIVGLMELENDATPNSAIEDLVSALNAATAPGTYDFINTGVIGGDMIRVALIYKPAAVTPVGSYQIITSATDPRFVDTLNRPSLAQTFQQNSTGGRLTVVVNHLKSKNATPACGPDPGDGQGNCNLARKNAAEALVDWLATDPTGSGDSDFLLIGDMNSYTFEDPIKAFEDGGFTNLIRHFNGLTPYSFVFNGEAGYLDHALASPSLAAQATGATDWHINADEPIVLDYNTNFKTANQINNTFYDPGPYRSSDHDPVVVGISLVNAPPTVSAGGPYTVDEGGTVTVDATGNDPDGGTVSFAWDLDDNGSFETLGQSVTFDASTIDGPDSRTIRVQATDPGGSSAAASTTVTINNAPPEATFNPPATALAGFPFTISLTSPHDPAPADTFQYAFDCGTGYAAFGAASSANCTSTSTGPLTVRGTIKDDDGDSTEYTATVTVGVTYDSLCDLTRAYVTKKKVEDSLCDELDKAAAADAKGDLRKKQEHLRHYVEKVRKESGKSLTAAQANTLIELAGEL